ncbi:conserved hypothetical protein [Trichinella spiralis]|uniref:Uncharacterized protein n=1 Tax=Trichinella spiralis TaxID=6334 RepID=E5SU05_TRISP|nr:conserved hypothetical protein [Trichinella spiralis]KRY31082.1 hypothetical protein T01_5536 [Trichinella spiralis]
MHFGAARVAPERRAAFVQYHTDGGAECNVSHAGLGDGRLRWPHVGAVSSLRGKRCGCILETCAGCSRMRFLGCVEQTTRSCGSPCLVDVVPQVFNGFANITEPLHRLLEKGAELDWSKACQSSFVAVKYNHTSAPILSICSSRRR